MLSLNDPLVATFHDFDTLQLFIPNSSVWAYLVMKRPCTFRADVPMTTLRRVFLATQLVISEERLVDNNNLQIMLPDVALGWALQTTAMHIDQIMQVSTVLIVTFYQSLAFSDLLCSYILRNPGQQM